MKLMGSCFRCGTLSLLVVLAGVSIAAAQAPKAPGTSPAVGNATNGRQLFDTNCGSCHGRGGGTGPDLAESKLLESDQFEVALADYLQQGNPDKGMPQFTTFSGQQIADLAAGIKMLKGTKRRVDPSDLLTGNVEAGSTYFNGAGRCSTCHSATGDLAGVASRHIGTQLMQQIIYPRNPKKKVTVTLPSGTTMTGTLEHADRFIVALRDANGFYRSWFTDRVKYFVDAPVDAHAELLRKHTDRDIHNLYAYLQTLVAPKGEGDHKTTVQPSGNTR